MTAPRSKFYADLINILEDLTGEKWLHASSAHRVKYLYCEKIPLKIAAQYDKPYEKNIKYVIDIPIENKYPRSFASHESWVDAVTSELQIKLLQRVVDATVRRRIGAWKPGTDYSMMIREAAEQSARWGDVTGESYDIYFDRI